MQANKASLDQGAGVRQQETGRNVDNTQKRSGLFKGRCADDYDDEEDLSSLLEDVN